MTEQWKAVPGFEGYAVSDHGRVRSYMKRYGNGWGIADEPQRILRFATKPDGYRGINLSSGGVVRFCKIADLVLLAFVGPKPAGMETCHNNDKAGDDRLTNLRYDTHAANMADIAKNGGRRPVREVRDIRARYARGDLVGEIARRYGVLERTIHAIATGRCFLKAGGQVPKRRHIGRGEAVVIQIREERAGGALLSFLATKYGLDQSGISLICSGKRHRQYGGPLTIHNKEGIVCISK